MPTSDWTPSVDAVAELLRARTRNRNGAEVGTFNDDAGPSGTRPTATQVTGHITRAMGDVVSVVGADVPANLWADASYVVTLGAAMQVELSYFPEQIGTNRSPYDRFKDLYDERLARLKAAVIAENAGGSSADPGAALKPSYAFPMDGDPQLLGRRTAW